MEKDRFFQNDFFVKIRSLRSPTNNSNTGSEGATFKSALKATNEGPVEIEASMRILCLGPCTEADAGSPKHDAITSILLVLS